VNNLPVVHIVEQLLSKPLITVDVDASCRDAVKLMIKKGIGSLSVTKRGKPVGIITERDILKKMVPYPSSLLKSKVKEIMSTPIVTIDVKKPICSALQIVTEKNIRRLLVTERKKIIGIVTEKDLMRGTRYFRCTPRNRPPANSNRNNSHTCSYGMGRKQFYREIKDIEETCSACASLIDKL